VVTKRSETSELVVVFLVSFLKPLGDWALDVAADLIKRQRAMKRYLHEHSKQQAN